MSDSLRENLAPSLFISVFRKINIEIKQLRFLCSCVPSAQSLLKARQALGAGGSISFFPLSGSTALLKVQGSGYASVKGCADAVEGILSAPGRATTD